MHRDIQKKNKLLIVSDTGMFLEKNKYRAFGPVVKEIEYFLRIYQSVNWIGFNKPEENENNSFINVPNQNVNILALRAIGGKTFLKKMQILISYPKMFFILLKQVKKHQHIHVRAPSHPALLAMVVSVFYPKKRFWFKYAGNWIEKASKYYEFQRFVLKYLRNNAIITVNGKWKTKNKNISAFENPCITETDRTNGKKIINTKQLNKNKVFCFVGALNTHKGVDLILETLKEFENSNNIAVFHFVGDGPNRKKYELIAGSIKNIKILFHGYLSKDKISEIYKISDFILLPSKSEGFPKVIGEAMNFGCVPVVSDVSSIGQYIHHNKNGFLIRSLNKKELTKIIKLCLKINPSFFRNIITDNYILAKKFTYTYYLERINTEIFN